MGAFLLFMGVGLLFLALFMSKSKDMPKLITLGVRVVAAILLILALNPLVIVRSGYHGLKFTFGSVQKKELTPGINIRIPIIQEVKSIDIRPQQENMTIEVGTNGALTKDNQTVGSTMTFFFKYKPGELALMWQSFGSDQIAQIVSKSAAEAFKSVIGKYEIFDVPTKQTQIRNEVMKLVIERLANYPVDFTDLQILNYDWSESFDLQISQTMERAQKVKQATQDLLITEQNAQKQVKEAEAAKLATIAQAEGEKAAAILLAEAKMAEGEGIRKYNESIEKNKALELEFRRLEIEKIKAGLWDGAYVPNNMYGPIPVNTQGGVQQ